MIRLKHFSKSKYTSLFNNNSNKNSFKNLNKITPINLKSNFNKNKNKNRNKKIIYKPVNYLNENEKFQEISINKNKDKERFKFIKLLNYTNNRNNIQNNNFMNSHLIKRNENEIIDNNFNKKQSNTIYYEDKNYIKDRLPFNTLKHYHRYLFNENKDDCKREREEQYDRKENYNQSYDSNSADTKHEYDIIEFDGKKNYIATKLTRITSEKKTNDCRSKSLMGFNLKKIKKQIDYHYIMKHPFSNSFFCSSFINQLTENNNSYTNNFSEKFKNLNNPLNDKDLTDKLHNLILNPNTSKLRNGQLFLMYKNFPKGTFYNIFNNRNNNNCEDTFYNEILKNCENEKYRKFIIKLNKSMEKAKNIQKRLNILIYNNKKNLM